MMAAGKKKPEDKNTDTLGSTRSMRSDAEEQIARSPKSSSDLKGQTSEQLIHELNVHQIELETQAEELQRTRVVLEELKDKYLDLYDFAPLGYIMLNDKALITEVNLTGATLLGANRNDILNHGLGRFIAPADLENWDRYFAKVRRHVKKQVCTLTLLRQDKTVFPARLEGVRTTGMDGTIAVRIAISDITDISDADKALRQSEDRFRQLFTRMPSAVAIYDCVDVGEDFIIKDFNAAAEKIEGIKKDDIIGKRVTQVFPGVRDFGIFAVFQRVWRTGQFEFFPSAIYRDERDPGTWRENWVYKLASGEVIAIYHDITERKRVEEALHESARYTRNLIEVSLDPLVTISPEGKITDVNAATERITGYTRNYLIGTDFSDYFTDPDKARKGYRKAFDEGIVEHYPLEIQHRDGKITPVMYNATIYRDDSGAIKGVFAAARDITERKQAEEALHQANKKLTLLSGITRHDINNQLSVLRGYLTILENKQPDPALTEYFQKLNTAAQRIANMIQFTKEYESIGINAPAWQDCRTLLATAAHEAPLGQVMVKNDLPAGEEVFADHPNSAGLTPTLSQCMGKDC